MNAISQSFQRNFRYDRNLFISQPQNNGAKQLFACPGIYFDIRIFQLFADEANGCDRCDLNIYFAMIRILGKYIY